MWIISRLISILFLLYSAAENFLFAKGSPDSTRTPTSVNFHFTRKCNYSCGFCFHTAKTDTHVDLEEAKRGLRLLKDAGMRKINFSGGEPFIVDNGKYVGEMVRFCKEDLGIESVTIVSNGSLIKKHWFKKYGSALDILAVSCDSFSSDTNRRIGRAWQGSKPGQGKDHIQSLLDIRQWCDDYGVRFKLNTVVNTYNWEEDMSAQVDELAPCRWKVFQCLLIDGENAGENKLRDAEPFYISTEKFQAFVTRHKSCQPAPTVEDNSTMRNSYYILDEQMRFLDCSGGAKVPGPSILDVGVAAAARDCHFDEVAFIERDGIYDWAKPQIQCSNELDW